ncbi:hypothetical protein [Gordonibacter sp.]|uniref:hypothetical protein n=1 Tax=Gordonibacter sp. TaxID=1968902 RepID=UPI002FC77B3C
MHGEDNEYYDLEDMPPCRSCGCAPVLKGNPTANGCGNTRLQCPECGIRTGMSTNDQGNYRVWAALMGGGATEAAAFSRDTPGCSCNGLRQALADAAAKELEIARSDAVVEERQSGERTCRLVETDDKDGHGNSYGKSIRCSACNKPLKRKLVSEWSGIQFCYRCGAKVVDA